MNDQLLKLLQIIKKPTPVSASEASILFGQSLRSTQRALSKLVQIGFITKLGSGKNTKYELTPIGILNYIPDLNKDLTDERLNNSIITFNHDIFKWLNFDIFNQVNILELENSAKLYQEKLKNVSKILNKKEYERLIIEFSWKSSSFEGDTYTLLETERLILDNKTNPEKPKTDALIILNHKNAFDFILKNPGYYQNITEKKIRELHILLTHNLGINSGYRNSGVGITGSLYKPIDNALEIQEKVNQLCILINNTENGFKKAFLTNTLISYIQPFEDGNKRTSRTLANAILFNYNLPLISYRSVTIEEYRNAVLAFYELNSIHLLREIFVSQVDYCAKNYF